MSSAHPVTASTISAPARQRAVGHGKNNGLGDRAAVFQHLEGYPQEVVLGFVGIDHEAAFEGVGATGHVGQQGGQ